MIKLLLFIVGSIAALVAGAYFYINPLIPICLILGFAIYMARGGPLLPKGTYIPWRLPGGPGGVYMRGRDYVQDDDARSGEDPRQADGFR